MHEASFIFFSPLGAPRMPRNLLALLQKRNLSVEPACRDRNQFAMTHQQVKPFTVLTQDFRHHDAVAELYGPPPSFAVV
jgi:hypothetical protein